jgi:hypothetical protein
MPDLARDPVFLRRRRLRRIGYVSAVTIVLIGISMVLARMDPAAPTIDGCCATR